MPLSDGKTKPGAALHIQPAAVAVGTMVSMEPKPRKLVVLKVTPHGGSEIPVALEPDMAEGVAAHLAEAARLARL